MFPSFLVDPNDAKKASISKSKNKSVCKAGKNVGDRIGLYLNLKEDPVRKMNDPMLLPLKVTGPDMKTYVIDQYPDSDGIFQLYVLLQTGPYEYTRLYAGKPFKFSSPTPVDQTSTQSTLNVDHYMGNENTTDVISDSEVPVNLGINWTNVLKKAPITLGHVVQIGTAVAALLQDETDVVIPGKNVEKTSYVPFKTGFFRLLIHDLDAKMQSLSVACFDTPPTPAAMK